MSNQGFDNSKENYAGRISKYSDWKRNPGASSRQEPIYETYGPSYEILTSTTNAVSHDNGCSHDQPQYEYMYPSTNLDTLTSPYYTEIPDQPVSGTVPTQQPSSNDIRLFEKREIVTSTKGHPKPLKGVSEDKSNNLNIKDMFSNDTNGYICENVSASKNGHNLPYMSRKSSETFEDSVKYENSLEIDSTPETFKYSSTKVPEYSSLEATCSNTPYSVFDEGQILESIDDDNLSNSITPQSPLNQGVIKSTPELYRILKLDSITGDGCSNPVYLERLEILPFLSMDKDVAIVSEPGNGEIEEESMQMYMNSKGEKISIEEEIPGE